MALAFIFQDQLAEVRSLGLLGIFILNLIGSATLFIPAPAIASVVAGGIIYHPFLVALVAALGSVLGDMIGYLVGYSGKKVFIKNHPGRFGFFQKIFHRFGGVAIFIFALIPNPVFDAIGILAGVFSYSPLKFFAISFGARLLRNLVLAYFGSVL
jgi:membrane protein YqaA with SNARE-associated domain